MADFCIFLHKQKWVFLILFIILVPRLGFTFTITSSNTVTISAQVVANNGTPNNNGGGRGVGIIPTTINFSGMAYPMSRVTILRNGVIVLTTVADSQANFLASLNNASVGTYTFSVYAEDSSGVKSPTFSFPVNITSSAIVNISGIFIAPTINVDKTKVKKGEILTIFGQTTPSSNVNIFLNSNQNISQNITSNNKGLYKYLLNTTLFNYGDYNVVSKTTKNNRISPTSAEIIFTVGISSEENITNCNSIRADLNCDGRVNLIDFSIMAYWYKRANSPKRIDLNGDRKVDLIDFSILAFYWTG